MMKQLLFATLFISFNSFAETNSEKFSSFNTDSVERQQFIKEQNGRVNLRLKSSKNFKKIEKDFLELGKQSKKLEIVGSNKKTYTLLDKGLGKAQELIETTQEGVERVVFSSFSLAKNNSYNIVNFKLNPSENKVVMTLSYKGSIDGYMLLTVDLETGKILYRTEERDFYNTSFVFYDDNSIVNFSRKDEKINALSILDGSITKVILENIEDAEEYEDFLSLYTADYHNLIMKGTKIRDLGQIGNIEILGQSKNTLFLKRLDTVNQKDIVSIIAYDLELNAITKTVNLESEPEYVYILEKSFVVETLEGLKRELVLYDFDGRKISTLTIPFCCQVFDVENFSNLEAGNVTKVKVTLRSPVKRQAYEWNLDEKSATIPLETISSMLESPEFSIVVEAKSVKSFDGTVIPYLMIYKKGVTPFLAPTYMEVYGGFGSSSYLINRFDAYVKKFIMRGGVYIGPGVRGGPDFGTTWHTAAMKENKYKTYEDVASVAKDLIEKKVTVREKIAIAGSSNGGLTVAATGLMFPQYFGLIIPHNGVLDMLGKEVLDPNFGFGWSREYGDSRIPEVAKYISKYSPVERVTEVRDLPRFLVINGRTDTRVNLAHSVKFAAAAKSVGADSVELISINNSGHFNLSISYSDYIAWRTSAVKWATIYDVMGMEY